MPTSLLTPPSDQRPVWPETPAERPPKQRRRRRAPIALALVTTALAGGVVGHATGSTTTVQQAATPVQRTAGDGLNASSLYASTSAGVVDIAVKSASSAASGTGFVVDKAGNIVTAAHVVDGATSVTVRFEDGTTRKATVLGKDNATDIAVIKVDPSGLTLRPLTLGSSASLDVGAEVAAIGDPFGYARSISTGIVSGVDRTIKAPNGFTVAHAIQTDAAMNPGNSGGPVLDADGKVVGIADQIATSGSVDQSSGVGFAVPIDLVKSSLKTLEAGGQVKHAYLGVGTGDSATAGATLSGVKASGPAAQAGLRTGDVVTALDGTTVADSNDLVAAIAAHQPGDQVKLTVKRGSETLHPTVTLGTQ